MRDGATDVTDTGARFVTWAGGLSVTHAAFRVFRIFVKR